MFGRGRKLPRHEREALVARYAGERPKKRPSRRARKKEGGPVIGRRELVLGSLAVGTTVAVAGMTRPSEERRLSREDMESQETNLVGSEEFMRRVEAYEEFCENDTVKLVAFLDEHGGFLAAPAFYAEEGEPPEAWIEEKRAAAARASGKPYVAGEAPPMVNASFVEVLEYHGDAPRRELSGKSAVEHVKLNAEEVLGGVPRKLKGEFARLLPGIAGQESQYNNRARSRTGAKGVFQFMPDTWSRFRMHHPDAHTRELGEEPEARPYESLPDQTRAAGWYLGEIYDYLESHLTRDERTAIKRYFRDEDEFEKYFMVPCTINGYNAGEGRMAKVMGWFARQVAAGRLHPLRNSGYDVFHLMAEEAKKSSHQDTAGYGPDASTYFFRVYTYARIVERPLAPAES